MSVLDASKAFDRVDHNTLFKKLDDRYFTVFYLGLIYIYIYISPRFYQHILVIQIERCLVRRVRSVVSYSFLYIVACFKAVDVQCLYITAYPLA